MSKKIKSQYRTHFFIAIIVAIAIVILLNVLAYEFFYRYDLTQNKDYSLSEASKQVLASLEDKVVVDVYFTEELPPEYLHVRQSVGDLLDEYDAYSNDKLEINFTDPKNDDDLKQELKLKGIPELQFNILEKDQFQVTTGYLGIVVSYLDKEELLPVVDNTANFEYDLTSAIKNVSAEQEVKVAWAKATGSDTADFDSIVSQSAQNSKYSQAITELKKSFAVTEINLNSGNLLDNSYKTLIVAGNEEVLEDKALYVIDQFLMQGGSVLFLVDGVTVNQSLQAKPNEAGLDKLISNYGINISDKLVLDQSSEVASFSGGFMTFMVDYPYWVKISKQGLSQNHVAVADLESLVLPWASYIDIDNNILNNHQVDEIIKSSEKSWLSKEPIDLDPQKQRQPSSFEQYTIGATVIGKFDSYFKGQSSPIEDQVADQLEATDNGRIAVIADADFVSDSFLNQYPSNYLFIANILDWLNQDEDLIAIRSKKSTDRSIKELTDKQKTIYKYGNIFGLTVIVIMLGLIRFFIRRKKFKKIKLSLK